MRDTKSLILTLLLLVGITSCHTTKVTKVEHGAVIEGGGESVQWEALTASYGAWSDVKMPVTLSLESPAAAQISGSVVMERGRSVYMSYKFLGIEVLNMQITPDSVFAAYKPGKLYVAESLASLTGKFPMTISDLQDLMLGRAFAIEGASPRLAESADGVYSAIMPPVQGIGYGFTIQGDQVIALTIEPKGSRPVVCMYDADVATPVGAVAPRLSVAVPSGSKVYAGSLSYNLGKASWDKGETRQWRRPKGYKQATIAEIFKML